MAPRIIGLRGRRPVGRRLSGVCRCGPAVSWCPSPPPSLSCDFGRDLQAFEESPFLTPLTHSPPPPCFTVCCLPTAFVALFAFFVRKRQGGSAASEWCHMDSASPRRRASNRSPVTASCLGQICSSR